MKKTILLILLNMLLFKGYTQNSISGSVVDEEGNPIEGNSVFLQNIQDSTIILGQFFLSSSFQLEGFEEKEFLLCISNLSFEKKCIPLYMEASQQIMGNISLIPLALEEVTVRGSKTIVTHKHGVSHVKVEGTRLEYLGFASDVLQHTPKVRIDREEVMVGTKKALIIVNGKEMPEMDIASIPSGMIKSVEVTEKPSMKYGALAVINIKTKRGVDNVWGKVNSDLLFRKRFSTINALSLGLNKKKWGVLFSYRNIAGDDQKVKVYDRVIDFNTSHPRYIYNRENSLHSYRNYHRFWLNSSYDFSDKVSLNIKAHLTDRDLVLKQNNQILERNQQLKLTDDVLSKKKENKRNDKAYVFGNISRKLDHLGSEISLSAQWFQRHIIADETTNDYDRIVQTLARTIILDKNFVYSSYRFALDGTQFLNKSHRLQFGLSYGKIETSETYEYIKGGFKNTDYTYTEPLSKGYLSYLFNTKKGFNFDMGLRVEYLSPKGYDNLLQISDTDYSYINWIPSTTISQRLSKNFELLFDFSRWTNRPNFSHLSPNEVYIDATTFEVGNPYLKASYDNKWNFSLIGFEYAKLGVFYGLRQKEIVIYFDQIIRNGIEYTQVSRENIDQTQTIGFEVQLPFKQVWKAAVLEGAAYFNWSRLNYDFGQHKEMLRMLDETINEYTFYLYSSFSFLDDMFAVSSSYSYKPTFYNELFKVKPMHILSFEAGANFFDKKLFLKLKANDVLGGYNARSRAIINNLDVHLNMEDFFARSYVVSVGYRFNTNKRSFKGSVDNKDFNR